MPLPEPKKNAFTLIEILVTTVIIAILFTVGMINWNQTIQKQRVINARDQIETALAAGFSVSRSQGKSVKIYGNKGDENFCIDEKEKFGTQTCSENCRYNANNANEFESNIKISTDFCLIYTNAFGDLSGDSIADIKLESDHYKSKLEIDSESGLITAHPVEKIQ